MSQFRFILKRVTDGSERELTGTIVVGHLPECGLRLEPGGPTGGPSRRHAQLSVLEDKVILEDLRSTNGTFVNDVRISAPTPLRSNDRVRFDQEAFTFRAESLAPAEQKTQIRAPVEKTVAKDPPSIEKPVAKEPQPLERAAAKDPQPAEKPVVKEPQPAEKAVRKDPQPSFAYPSWQEQSKGKNKTVFWDPSQMQPKPDAPAVAVPEDIDEPCLLVLTGSRAGARIALQAPEGAKREWSIGSESGREILFGDEGVSGRHAKLVNEGERWKLVDQLASNGTRVNGTPTNLSYLRSGDRLQFGPVDCLFCLPKTRLAAMRMGMSKGRLALVALASFVVTIVVIFVVYRLLMH